MDSNDCIIMLKLWNLSESHFSTLHFGGSKAEKSTYMTGKDDNDMTHKYFLSLYSI